MRMSTKVLAVLATATLNVMGARYTEAAITPYQVFTQYSFSASSPTPSSTEIASTGLGTATSLGMTNSYTYSNGEGPGAVDGSNITTTAGTAHPTFSERTWRIVGNSNAVNAGAGKANGWNNAAPDYSQGAMFGANLSSYSAATLSGGFVLEFDWYATNQGVGNLQPRYSLDGTTFTNIGPDLVATPNDYYLNASRSFSNIVDLSSIAAAAANDPNFAIELVSVRPVPGDSNYVAGGPGEVANGDDGAYAGALGGDYNNNSGNWRFDNVTVAVPEPTSAGLLGVAVIALLGSRRRNRSA